MRCVRGELQSVWHDEFHWHWGGGSPWSLHIHFAWCDFYAKVLKYLLIPTSNMAMQNGHDTNFHILHPTDNEFSHARPIEVYPSNISWHLLLAAIFNSQTFARMCMVNVLLHRRCEVWTNLHSKLGCGAVMQPFLTGCVPVWRASLFVP